MEDMRAEVLSYNNIPPKRKLVFVKMNLEVVSNVLLSVVKAEDGLDIRFEFFLEDVKKIFSFEFVV